MSTLIGTGPDQVPVNGMLGDMAFQNQAYLSVSNLTASGIIIANSYIATSNIASTSNYGAFVYGNLNYVDTNIFCSFTTSANSYAQNILENTNTGSAASVDYIVSSSSGGAATNYGDFGINGSGFSGAGAFNQPNYTYLTATTGDLAIGTTTTNSIHFVVNNGTTDAMTISSTGQLSVQGLIASSNAAPTIASATTIAPNTKIVFISGTTPIATITAPAPISTGGGEIKLIPTGIFTTTTAGNIALASTAIVGKVLIMTYDATTTKWYPSY